MSDYFSLTKEESDLLAKFGKKYNSLSYNVKKLLFYMLKAKDDDDSWISGDKIYYTSFSSSIFSKFNRYILFTNPVFFNLIEDCVQLKELYNVESKSIFWSNYNDYLKGLFLRNLRIKKRINRKKFSQQISFSEEKVKLIENSYYDSLSEDINIYISKGLNIEIENVNFYELKDYYII